MKMHYNIGTVSFVESLLVLYSTCYFFRICGVDYPPNKVMVHQVMKGTYAPSLGHFVVKLETYLRMAKIPYEVLLCWVFI